MGNIYLKLREEYKPEGSVLSQRRLSTMIGIPHSRISDIESGVRTPSISELKKYHHFFKVSYEYLLEETSLPVCADVFHDKPEIESDLDHALRHFSASKNRSEKQIWTTIVLFLTTPKGLAFLYYTAQYITGKKELSLDDLSARLFETKEFDSLSYSEIRVRLDHD